MTDVLHTSPYLKPPFALPYGALALQPHGARLSQYTPFQCIQLSHTVTSSLRCLCHSGWLSLRQGNDLAGVGYHPVLMGHLCTMRADCDAVTWAHTPSSSTEIYQMTWGGGNDEVPRKGLTVQDIPEANLSMLDLRTSCQVSPKAGPRHPPYTVTQGTGPQRWWHVGHPWTSPWKGSLRWSLAQWQQGKHELEDTMHLQVEGQAQRGGSWMRFTRKL